MTTRKLESLLGTATAGSLGALVRTARDMGDLTAALRAALAPELAGNILAANLRETGQLVIICQSSAWAARIRFESEALLAAARARGFDATSLRVSVSRS